MNTRYFRMKVPDCGPEEIEWIEMSGREFYRFVNSPEGQGRHFIDMGDVVLEAPETDAREYRAEQKHRQYIQAQEMGWSTLSLYAIEGEDDCNGEEVIQGNAKAVEAEAILRMEIAELHRILSQLDEESYQLVYSLYLAETRKTLRHLSQSTDTPVMTLQDRKKKILAHLARELLNKKF